MGRSQNSFIKKKKAEKKRKKKEEKFQKRLEKAKEKKEEKEESDTKPGALENMIAHVDEYGNIIPEEEMEENQGQEAPAENKDKPEEKE